jgi:hypothetical protein
VTVPGFTVHSLSVPTGGGALTFNNVPVYIANVGSGFDGVLGMNLFNRAASMLYNPYGQGGASLSVSFRSSATTPAGAAGGITPGRTPIVNLPVVQPPGTTTGRPPLVRRPSFMIFVSPDAVLRGSSSLTASPGLQQGSYLFLVLQTQPGVPAGGNPWTPQDGAAASSGMSRTPGYAAIYVAEEIEVSPARFDATSQPETPQSPAATEETPAAPFSDENQSEAVSAFFAATLERVSSEDETPVWEDHSSGETLAKLALVVAGLWGSVYKKEPEPVRCRPATR